MTLNYESLMGEILFFFFSFFLYSFASCLLIYKNEFFLSFYQKLRE